MSEESYSCLMLEDSFFFVEGEEESTPVLILEAISEPQSDVIKLYKQSNHEVNLKEKS